MYAMIYKYKHSLNGRKYDSIYLSIPNIGEYKKCNIYTDDEGNVYIQPSKNIGAHTIVKLSNNTAKLTSTIFKELNYVPYKKYLVKKDIVNGKLMYIITKEVIKNGGGNKRSLPIQNNEK